MAVRVHSTSSAIGAGLGLESRGLATNGEAKLPVHFSPVHGVLDPRDLAEWILEDGLRVRLNLQLHKYVWGADASGV